MRAVFDQLPHASEKVWDGRCAEQLLDVVSSLSEFRFHCSGRFRRRFIADGDSALDSHKTRIERNRPQDPKVDRLAVAGEIAFGLASSDHALQVRAVVHDPRAEQLLRQEPDVVLLGEVWIESIDPPHEGVFDAELCSRQSRRISEKSSGSGHALLPALQALALHRDELRDEVSPVAAAWSARRDGVGEEERQRLRPRERVRGGRSEKDAAVGVADAVWELERVEVLDGGQASSIFHRRVGCRGGQVLLQRGGEELPAGSQIGEVGVDAVAHSGFVCGRAAAASR